MIFGNINQLGNLNKYHPIIQEALLFLKKNNMMDFFAGEHQQRNFLLQVHDIKTKAFGESRIESHKNVIDLQFLASDSYEKIGYAPMDSDSSIIEKNIDRDIYFYENPLIEDFISLCQGSFALFSPEDLHRPALHYEQGKSENIRKIVLKINCEKLSS